MRLFAIVRWFTNAIVVADAAAAQFEAWPFLSHVFISVCPFTQMPSNLFCWAEQCYRYQFELCACARVCAFDKRCLVLTGDLC